MGVNLKKATTDVDQSTVPATDFLAKVEELISPSLSECFSDETRKIRDKLLTASVIPILVALGVASLQESNDKLPFHFLRTSLWPFVAVCFYFLILFAGRCFPEWKAWRLRHQAPMIAYKELAAELGQDSVKLFNTNFGLYRAASYKWQVLTQEPPHLVELWQRWKDSGARFSDLTKRSRDTGFNDTALLDEMTRVVREGDEIYREYSAQRDAWYKSTETERKDLEQAMHTALNDPCLEALNARIRYMRDAIGPVPATLRIRLLFEMLLPIGFGLVGLSMGVWQITKHGV